MQRPNQLVNTDSLEWTDQAQQGQRASLIGLPGANYPAPLSPGFPIPPMGRLRECAPVRIYVPDQVRAG